MVEEGDHWASDAISGAAALGWAVGHLVASKHMDLEIAGFEPPTTSGEPTTGLSLVKQF